MLHCSARALRATNSIKPSATAAAAASAPRNDGFTGLDERERVVTTSSELHGGGARPSTRTPSLSDRYAAQSTLPTDFLRSLHHHLGVQYFHPVLLGLRTTGMRGLFLPKGHSVARNEVIAAIPLNSILTNEALMREHVAVPEVTLQRVTEAIPIAEMKMMAPQLHLGAQFALISRRLPDRTKCHSQEAIDAADVELRRGIAPWVRMVDDENYSQEWIDSTYAQRGLDNIQGKSYRELSAMFKKTSVALHEAIAPDMPIDHFRRHLRLIISRADAMAPASCFSGSRWARRFYKLRRTLLGQRLPLEVCLIPLADMLNHSNRPNVTTRVELNSARLGGAHAILVQSIRDIGAGEELCRHYNFAMTRDAALFRYGFLPYEIFTIHENNHYESHVESVKGEFMERKSQRVMEREREVQEQVSELEQLFKAERRPP